MNIFVLLICVALVAAAGIILYRRWFKECPNCKKNTFGNVADISLHEDCDEHSYCPTVAEIWSCRTCGHREKVILEDLAPKTEH